MVESFEFDIFLGGPFEKYAPYNYKQQIKAAFPELRIYDPESLPEGYDPNNWFNNNYYALMHSKAMIAMVPPFTMPILGPEVGIFLRHKCGSESCRKLEELVIIWPDNIPPGYTKKHMTKFTDNVVENPEEAIPILKKIFYKQ